MRVEGEPYVDHIFATVDDYEAATGKTIDAFNEAPELRLGSQAETCLR